jgi:hypothetical protein
MSIAWWHRFSARTGDMRGRASPAGIPVCCEPLQICFVPGPSFLLAGEERCACRKSHPPRWEELFGFGGSRMSWLLSRGPLAAA